MRVKFSLYFLFASIIFLQIACQKKTGVFAFSVVEHNSVLLRESEAIEESYQPKVFRRKKNPIVFPQGSDVWCLYAPASPRSGKTYALSLSKKTLGYNEIDLRNQILNRSQRTLLQKYSSLPVGHYLLRIALENKVIDSVAFEIRPDEKNHVIDYEAPLREEQPNASQQRDDILYYSR